MKNFPDGLWLAVRLSLELALPGQLHETSAAKVVFRRAMPRQARAWRLVSE
jgi:hypothetical protein